MNAQVFRTTSRLSSRLCELLRLLLLLLFLAPNVTVCFTNFFLVVTECVLNKTVTKHCLMISVSQFINSVSLLWDSVG